MSGALRLHACCVALDETGILISGEAGSGKTSLCFALMALGGRLVSDDYTELTREEEALYAEAPAAIDGLIELHGGGVFCAAPHMRRERVAVGFEVGLFAPSVKRLPERMSGRSYHGLDIPFIPQPARDASVSAKILFLAQLFQQRGQLETVSVAMPVPYD